MRTTAIINLKGGVGKSTTAINLAYNLATIHQKRVLLVDADHQSNTTEFFGGAKWETLADLLTKGGDAVYDHMVVQEAGYPNLSILPASDSLMDLDLTAVVHKRVNISFFVDFLLRQAEDDRFDHVIVDCSPAFSAATSAALAGADDVIIPIKLDAFSLRGMANLLHQVNSMRKINPKLRVAGCLPTMMYSSPTMTDALATLQKSGLPVYKTFVRRSAKVDGMTFAQEPLQVYSPNSGAGRDYRAFAKEFLEVV